MDENLIINFEKCNLKKKRNKIESKKSKHSKLIIIISFFIEKSSSKKAPEPEPEIIRETN